MVPLQIPKIVYFGSPTSLYPFHFHGYEMLEGTPAYRVDLSDDELKSCLKSLAHFLKKLHSIKSVQASEMGAQIQTYDKTKVQIVIESLQKRMKAIQQKNSFEFDDVCIDQIIAQAKTVVFDRGNDCLVHGGLDCRHMLMQSNTLMGIIDWGDVDINHLVIDFVIIHGIFSKSMHETGLRHFKHEQIQRSDSEQVFQWQAMCLFSSLKL